MSEKLPETFPLASDDHLFTESKQLEAVFHPRSSTNVLCHLESYMKTQFLSVMVENVHNPRTLESEAGDFQSEHLNAQLIQRQKPQQSKSILSYWLFL